MANDKLDELLKWLQPQVDEFEVRERTGLSMLTLTDLEIHYRGIAQRELRDKILELKEQNDE